MATITATEMKVVLNTPQMTAANMETFIDLAIDLVNLKGADLPHMTGSSGSKSLTVESSEKALIFLAVRAIYHSDPSKLSVPELNLDFGDILSNEFVMRTIQEGVNAIKGQNVRVG